MLASLASAFAASTAGTVVRAGTTKVALLFLVRGPIPHAELWQRWLSAAVGLVVLRPAAELGCAPLHAAFLRRVCEAGTDGSSSSGGSAIYRQQQLFSIYIHSSPEFDAGSYPQDSIFHGRTVGAPTSVCAGHPSLACAPAPCHSCLHSCCCLSMLLPMPVRMQVPCRLPTTWGSHTTIEAVRMMLREALQVCAPIVRPALAHAAPANLQGQPCCCCCSCCA